MNITADMYRYRYPAWDLKLQAAVGITRQIRRHSADLTAARRILFTTNWIADDHRGRAFSWVRPTGSSGWELQEPRGLTYFPIYRHDRLGD